MSYLKSRTVWLGIVAAAIGGLQALTGGDMLGPETTEWVLVAVGCLGIILRKLTTGPVGG